MKISAHYLLVALVAAFASGASTGKQVIVSYPEDTPLSVLEEAKAAIIKAGGAITHEFNLIKGFAADAPAKILETLQTWDSHSNVLIEEDKVVSINES